MKMKSVVLFVVAIGCGTVAMLGVQKSLSGKGAKREDTVKVLVATTEIDAGVPLDPGNTAFKAWPKSTVPEGAVTKPEQYERRALKVRAYTGDIILQAKLGDEGQIGAACEIPQGMRVVTVSVDATKTHSGLMLPGNRVDVLVTYRARKSANVTVQKTKVVLENIKVFATDNRRDGSGDAKGENNAKNISLLVQPDQANLVMLAQSKGQLHLALRRDNDTTEGNTFAVDDEAFEDADVGMGDPGSEKEEGPQPREDVRSFLEKSQAAEPVTPQKVAAEPVEVKKPKWKMSIYSGGDVKVEEVDLPDEPVSEASPASDEPSAPSGRGAASRIKGLIIRFFAGA